MSIRETLRGISQIGYLAIPKIHYIHGLPPSLVLDAIEERDLWLIRCSHLIHDPIGEDEIRAVKQHIELPPQLETLLAETNGAELFRLHYKPDGFSSYWIARYRILSASELIRANQDILQAFRGYSQNDPPYRDMHKLNYVAFCDIGDANYLAISIEETDYGNVFFLDHDYGYYPLRAEGTIDAYTNVATSLEDWLRLLLHTRGSGGMGEKFIPL